MWRSGSGRKTQKRAGRGQEKRTDRWPSDYGKRAEEDERTTRGNKRKASKRVENVDEQGERANVRQSTPANGLRNKR